MSKLSFTEKGTGPAVILIHGFPLNKTIWEGFADELARSFQVFTIDLPGFGESPSHHSRFSIADIANNILEWIAEKGIKRPVLIGHSLGGYIVLAMVKAQPALPAGFVLFHSTALADSEEKKESRTKVLEFIDKNGVLTFTSNFIAPLFADQKNPAIEKVRNIAIQAQQEPVKRYTEAMRDRPDQTSLLKDFHRPTLIISGDKDPGIPIESVQKQAKLSKSIDLNVLTNVAHMGMYEARDKTISLIAEFVFKSNRQYEEI